MNDTDLITALVVLVSVLLIALVCTIASYEVRHRRLTAKLERYGLELSRSLRRDETVYRNGFQS